MLGQDFGPTVVQVIVTFVIGSGFYIARRATGWIIVPMVLHLMWDYSSFTAGDGHTLGGLTANIGLVVVIVGLTAGRKQLFGTAEKPVDESATV